MAFQFIHVTTASRSKPKKQAKGKDKKWTVRDIAGEAERDPEHSPHVASPQPPNLLHGISPKEAMAEAERRAEASSDPSGRKIRKDGAIALCGVASHHFTTDELADPAKREEYEHWRSLTLDYLKSKYGGQLLSVVEHTDEKHPHVHFYAVPEAGVGFNAKTLHDGFAAGAGATNPAEQKKLYNDAMRAFQDDFHLQVGVRCGQARLGPKRRRMSRADWLQEQQTLQTAADALRKIQRRAEAVINKAKKQAAVIVNDAKAAGEGWGLKIGGVLSAIAGSPSAMIEKLTRERDAARAKARSEQEAKAKAEADVVRLRLGVDQIVENKLQQRLQPLQSELERERRQRAEVERQLDAAKPKQPGAGLSGPA